jgi:hypothetical protein
MLSLRRPISLGKVTSDAFCWNYGVPELNRFRQMSFVEIGRLTD